MTSNGRHAVGSRILFAVFVAAILGAGEAARANEPGPPVYEDMVASELAEENAEAARLFREATAARDRGDLAAAHRGFERITVLVPNNPHAYRRLCKVELLEKGQEGGAIAHCRRALSLRDLPENHMAVATALIAMPHPSTLDRSEALEHAERALRANPDDPDTLIVIIQVSLANGNIEDAEQYARHMERVAPDNPATYALWAKIHMLQGRGSLARRSLEKAKEHGLSETAYRQILKKLDGAGGDGETSVFGRPLPNGPRLAAWIVGLWLAGFALLAGIGWILSRLVVRAAESMPAAGANQAPLPGPLRSVYRAVIWLTCVYFYGSLPIVFLGVLAIGGGLIYGFFAVGRIPIKLVVVLGLGVLVTAWAMAMSLWAIVSPRTPEDPGMPLDLDTEPRLRALLREVADRIGTPMVDRVFLTTGTELAVTERSWGLFGLPSSTGGRRSERCLILGAGALEGMPIRAFKAVLAHEYGHFKNEDTAGGGFALAMQRSLGTMTLALAEGGAAHLLSPAWWFVMGFVPLFFRISHGASRLQEILADRWAALAYGSESFERGLRHVITRSVRFGARSRATLKEVVTKKIPLRNFYTYEPEAQISEKELAAAFEEAYAHPASAYDSHPPPNQRIAWVHALAARGEPAAADDDLEAWSLFTDRTRLEEQMTKRLCDDLAGEGIFVPAA